MVKTKLPLEEFMEQYGGLYEASYFGTDAPEAFAHSAALARQRQAYARVVGMPLLPVLAVMIPVSLLAAVAMRQRAPAR